MGKFKNKQVIYTPKFFSLPSKMTIKEHDLKEAFRDKNAFRKFMKNEFGIILPKDS